MDEEKGNENMCHNKDLVTEKNTNEELEDCMAVPVADDAGGHKDNLFIEDNKCQQASEAFMQVNADISDKEISKKNNDDFSNDIEGMKDTGSYGACENNKNSHNVETIISAPDLHIYGKKYKELESRVLAFEDILGELRLRVKENFEANENVLSAVDNDLQAKAHETEFRQLRRDFDQFSKRLKRVVKAEDSFNAESLDAAKVPSDVLEITYAKTLNDIYGAMLRIYGDRESAEMVEDVRDNVRQFSAGVDFFRFDEGSFIVKGLSAAIKSKIVSVKQIHGTYIELFKMLSQLVPNYDSQDFRSFVETGSQEYTIEKVVAHERFIESIMNDIKVFRDELSNIAENVSFMAELQNNQLEDIASNSQELKDIKEQMKSIAKAINLHTKAISKLNRTITQMQDLPTEQNCVSEKISIPEISNIEEILVSRASKEELMAMSDEMVFFKANIESMISSMQQEFQENINIIKGLSDDGSTEKTNTANKRSNDVSGSEIDHYVSALDIDPNIDSNIHSNIDVASVKDNKHPDIHQNTLPHGVSEYEGNSGVYSPTENLCGKDVSYELDDLHLFEESSFSRYGTLPIEDVITDQLSLLGSATLKQLEKQINSSGFSIDYEKLCLVMSYLEQEQMVTSKKKGRYTFYSVTDNLKA